MKIGSLLLSLLVAAFSGLAAADESAEQIEEQRAVACVKLVKAGDAEALIAFMRANWVPATPGDGREANRERVARMLTERHAGLEIVGVLADEPHHLTVETSDEEGLELRFEFDFAPEPPHLIVGMGMEAGPRREGPPLPPFDLPAGADEERIASRLEAWFGELADQDLFSGSALVAWNGKTLFSGAWGLASHEWNIPNRLETRFDIGSINKSFTKIAIGQLFNQAKLSLDDRIADHLPSYPNAEVAGKITIRHLLEHTSGLGDIFIEEFFNSSKALYRTPADFFPLFAEQPLQFAPGAQSRYSNAGFMVLGAIIAAVSGVPYDEYVERHIFQPAGMTSAGFFAKDEPTPDIAVGYTRMGPDGETGELRNNLFFLPIKGNSAGSAQLTALDLFRFDDALRDHRLLPPAYTRWYFGGEEPQAGAKPEISAARASATTGIAGGAPGVSAILESNAELSLIVLSNYDAPITEAVARALFRPLRRALKP